MTEHYADCSYFDDPPGLREPSDCDCGAIPKKKKSRPVVIDGNYAEVTPELRVVIFVCPVCGYMLLGGQTDPHGSDPPECDHGLFFGTNPNGGGEADMAPVVFVPATAAEKEDIPSDISALEAFQRLQSLIKRLQRAGVRVWGWEDESIMVAKDTMPGRFRIRGSQR